MTFSDFLKAEFYKTNDIRLYSFENAWLYFALLRRRVENDNNLSFEEECWFRRRTRQRSSQPKRVTP